MDTLANQRVKRTQRDYTLAFKRSVIQQVEQGTLTYKQAQRQYGIQGRSTVLVWLRKLAGPPSRWPTLPIWTWWKGMATSAWWTPDQVHYKQAAPNESGAA